MRLTSSPMIATSCASIRGPGRVGVVRISQLSRHPRPYMPHNFIVPFARLRGGPQNHCFCTARDCCSR